MKTTIELPDELAAAARRRAAESGTTLRSLIEEALRRELDRRAAPREWTPRTDLAFGGGGYATEAAAWSWNEIREQSRERA